MTVFINLLFASCCTLFLATGIYMLCFRKLSFFKLNRAYLQIALLSSLAIPAILVWWNPIWLHTSTNAAKPITDASRLLNQDATLLSSATRPAFEWDISQLIFSVIAGGIIFFSIRFTRQLYNLNRLKKQTQQRRYQQTTVFHLNQHIAPFTFYKYIVINTNLYDEAALKMIITHEGIHVQQKHYIDIFLSEFFKIIFWFHPCSWLLAFCIRENLEHQTDALVLSTGVDAKLYQYHLLSISTTPKTGIPVVNFNYQHLKNRITMMNQKSTSQWALIRYTFALALCIPSLFFLPEPGYAQTTAKIEVRQANPKMTLPSSDSILYVLEGKKVSGEVLSKFSPSKIKAIKIVKGEEHISQLNYPQSWFTSATKGVAIITLKKSATRENTDSKAPNSKSLSLEQAKLIYFIDGKKASAKVAEALSPSSIASIRILKDKAALKKWKAQNSDGLIMITTKQ